VETATIVRFLGAGGESVSDSACAMPTPPASTMTVVAPASSPRAHVHRRPLCRLPALPAISDNEFYILHPHRITVTNSQQVCWHASKLRNSNPTVRTVAPVRPIAVVVRRAAVLAVCLVLSVIIAPTAASDPETEPASATTAPADGSVPSSPPAILNTPDGWTLGLGAKDEKQVPVAPLTTAVSSREYLSSGIFVGSLIGPEQPRGVLEVGYEIGCGIDMSTSDGVLRHYPVHRHDGTNSRCGNGSSAVGFRAGQRLAHGGAQARHS
jgi:hypothetical protein